MNKKDLGYSLSTDDIQKIRPNIKILIYPEFADYETIDEILDEWPSICILYLATKEYGHYTLLFRRKDMGIEYFDSMGMTPDNPLIYLDKETKIDLNEDYPYLLRLLYDSGRVIHYNDYRLQSKDPMITTCGRHIICRDIYRNKYQDIDDYVYNMFYKDKLDPDEVVLKITNKFWG